MVSAESQRCSKAVPGRSPFVCGGRRGKYERRAGSDSVAEVEAIRCRLSVWSEIVRLTEFNKIFQTSVIFLFHITCRETCAVMFQGTKLEPHGRNLTPTFKP